MGGEPIPMEKQPVVYILASGKNGTLYVGVTSNLVQRVWKHRVGLFEGFTKRYHVCFLVYFEMHKSMREAIIREKQIKWWRRKWKLKLIEEKNPAWKDLYEDIY